MSKRLVLLVLAASQFLMVLDAAVMNPDLAQYAEIGDGEHGYFGINDLRGRLPGALPQVGIA